MPKKVSGRSGGKAGADAKQRIMDAAVELLAHRSYAAVSTRDIARKAGVNLAMINYYYGGKLGLVKALVTEYVNRYYEVLDKGIGPSAEVETYVSRLIRNLIAFYRENLLLAVAAERTTEIENAELQELHIRLSGAHRPMVNNYFRDLGLDPDDRPTMAVFRGFLTRMVLMHFQARLQWQEQVRRRPRLKQVEERELGECADDCDDAFYEGFARVLETFYIRGARAVAELRRRPPEPALPDPDKSG